MYYIFIVVTLLFVANSCAMETNHQSCTLLTLRLTLCAKIDSDFLRDQMDRIPSSKTRRQVSLKEKYSKELKKIVELKNNKKDYSKNKL